MAYPSRLEKTVLQCAVGLAVLVPILAGGAGVILGPGMMGDAAALSDLDAHYRYLSGLLLAIGVAFALSIPRIESHKGRFRLLTAIVFTGGLSRLYGVLTTGHASHVTIFALAMELIVTPALAIWQGRIAVKGNRFSASN
jgi:hypothetical protein